MKRHPALAGLSRDHHQVLALALRLRRASAAEADRLRLEFLEHWEAHERHHFRLEEELLLPAYAAFGDPDEPLVAQAVHEHMLIRRDVAALADAAAADAALSLLHTLGEQLEAHVRLEERRLFPLVETALPEPELEALGARLAAAAA